MISEKELKEAESFVNDIANCIAYDCGRYDTAIIRATAKILSIRKNAIKTAIEALEFYANSEWNEDYPGGIPYKIKGESGVYLDMGNKACKALADLSLRACKKP